jgi:hypothetical protein
LCGRFTGVPACTLSVELATVFLSALISACFRR